MLDTPADGSGMPAATVRIGSRIHAENTPAPMRPQSELNNQSLPQKEDEDVEKPACKTCLNGGKGRHRADCPRTHGPVVDRQLSQDEPDEEDVEDEAKDEPNEVIDQINASEIKHPCCGSKGWRHKAGCRRGDSSFPEKVGSELQAEMDDADNDDDLERKSFDCDECGKTFEADPNNAQCPCGSNNIWPSGS